MHPLFDLQIDFFKPLWRRVLLVIFTLSWAAFEFYSGALFWGLIFGGLGILAVWQFFILEWPDAHSSKEVSSGGSNDSPDSSGDQRNDD